MGVYKVLGFKLFDKGSVRVAVRVQGLNCPPKK